MFASEKTLSQLKSAFKYIFDPDYKYPSYTPKLDPMIVSDKPFLCCGVWVQPIPCSHGVAGITTNYRIGNVAWLTDTNGIPDSSLPFLKNLDVLFIDGLRPQPHATHFHLEAALQAAQVIGATKTYLIHLTHDYDHLTTNAQLPAGIELAYDGLKVTSGE